MTRWVRVCNDNNCTCRVLSEKVNSIDRQLNRVIYKDVYDLKHQQVVDRIKMVEDRLCMQDERAVAQREETAKTRKQMVYGVCVALLLPSLTSIDDVVRWIVEH